MNKTPTPEQISKLPKWAQDHIKDLQRKIVVAEATAKRLTDEQTPSPIFVDDWYSEPSIKRYVQSPQGRITIEHADVHLEVYLAQSDDGQRMHGIELQWSPMEGGKRRLCGSEVAAYPRSFNTVYLVHKDNIK